jgi:hypothetical protein
MGAIGSSGVLPGAGGTSSGRGGGDGCSGGGLGLGGAVLAAARADRTDNSAICRLSMIRIAYVPFAAFTGHTTPELP